MVVKRAVQLKWGTEENCTDKVAEFVILKKVFLHKVGICHWSKIASGVDLYAGWV
jgi:hypothetical protein